MVEIQHFKPQNEIGFTSKYDEKKQRQNTANLSELKAEMINQ